MRKPSKTRSPTNADPSLVSLTPTFDCRNTVSAPAPQRRRCVGFRRLRLLAFAIVLPALLGALTAPQAYADIDDVTGTEKHWDGTVEVSTTTLTIREGERATYSVRLSEDPIYYKHDADDMRVEVPCADGDPSCEWWVFFHVIDHPRTEGAYDLDDDDQADITVTPSIGRTFNRSDYDDWKTISIAALEDDDSEDQTVVFIHEVWGDDTECPIHKVGRVTVRIIDNDGGTPSLPGLSIEDTTAEEGDTARFRVTLSPAAAQAATVRYQTYQGTADTTMDFVGKSGTLSFPAGTTEQFIEVQTREDATDEPDETFTVTLTDPSGATLLDDVGIGKITDDDPLPALSINDATAEEGETATFEVTLRGASQQTVTVTYRTVGGTAVEGTDYVATNGTRTFTAGTTRQTIVVQTNEDTADESDEAFTVELSSPGGATIADDSGSGTIRDDDDTVGDLPTLSIGDATAEEGETATFEVTLVGTSTQTVTVAYRTAGGTAVEGTDYVAADGMLTFTVGTTRQPIVVQTNEDTVDESDEAFTVELSSPSGATIADDSGSGTIGDDDDDGGGGDRDDVVNRNNDGDDVRDRIHTANWTVLPELGRAVAFTAVRCRIEQAFSDMARGWAKPSVRSSLPLTPNASAIAVSNARSPSLEQVVGNASFLVPLTGGEGGAARFAAWGCGDYRNLSGDPESRAGAWDGEVLTMQVGVDAMIDTNTLAGVSLSRSKGSIDFDGPGKNGEAGGHYDLQLTGVHPYVGWWASPHMEIWATLGLAKGTLRVKDDRAETLLSSSATLTSGTVGASGLLLELGPTTVRLKGEGALARLDVPGDNVLFRGASLDLTRLRLAAEIDHEQTIPDVGVLAPWGELGLRRDGGDGETGKSVEIGGGLHFRNIEQGWNAEVYGRWLAAQDDSLPQEQGFGARFRYDPRRPGFGPWVSLAQSWGEPASGVQQLWEEDDTTALAPHDQSAQRLEAEVGYGFPAFRGRGVITPYGAMSLEPADRRSYRIGGRLALGRTATFSLEATRRERPAETPDHTAMMRGAAHF